MRWQTTLELIGTEYKRIFSSRWYLPMGPEGSQWWNWTLEQNGTPLNKHVCVRRLANCQQSSCPHVLLGDREASTPQTTGYTWSIIKCAESLSTVVSISFEHKDDIFLKWESASVSSSILEGISEVCTQEGTRLSKCH